MAHKLMEVNMLDLCDTLSEIIPRNNQSLSLGALVKLLLQEKQIHATMEEIAEALGMLLMGSTQNGFKVIPAKEDESSLGASFFMIIRVPLK